jgi:hypothetical protein
MSSQTTKSENHEVVKEKNTTKAINVSEVATQILILAHSKIKPVQIKEAIFAHYENIKNSEYNQALEIAQAELDKLSSTDNNSIFKAFLFSFGAGVLTAVIWAVITVVSNFEIGYLAILIGFGVAYPVQKWMNKRGYIYQAIAVLAALFGVFLGKCLTVIFSLLKLTEFNLDVLQVLVYPEIIFGILSQDISPYDFLWVALACGYAFIMLNKPKLKVGA